MNEGPPDDKRALLDAYYATNYTARAFTDASLPLFIGRARCHHIDYHMIRSERSVDDLRKSSAWVAFTLLRAISETPVQLDEKGRRARELIRSKYSWSGIASTLAKRYSDVREGLRLS